MRLKAALFGVGLVMMASRAGAQVADPELTAAIAGRDEAAIKRDPAAMARYTADDYVAINPSGGRMTKQQRVEQIKTPAAPGSKPPEPMRTEAIHMYGAGIAVVRTKQPGNRQLHVWIKSPTGWQAVAIHVVPDAFLPQPRPLDRPKVAQPSVLVPPAGLSADRSAVFAAFKQIQDAFFSGDRATFDRLTAPEHAGLSPGFLRFAGEGSANIDGPRTQPKYDNITVQVWNSVGVVRWHEVTAAGRQQWLTRVFAKSGAGWQQVATASSASGNPAIAP